MQTMRQDPCMAPTCAKCKRDCELVAGAVVYPHRDDLRDLRVWLCRGCGARVGCHPGTSRPLGNPADAATRRARITLHNDMLDPLWKRASKKFGPPGLRRARTYRFLAHKLGLERDQTHTGMFDIETCRRAWRALNGVTYEQIHEWREAQKADELAGA